MGSKIKQTNMQNDTKEIDKKNLKGKA